MTAYLFEDAVDAARVTSEIYPDSSDTTSAGTDQVKIAYAVDGRVTTRTDQRQAVIAFAYDSLRRPKSQKATSLGDAGQNVDGFVRSITRGYDSLGRLSKITSHGNQTDDPDNTADVKNQVVFTYNDLGQVTKSEQAHGGVVGMGTPAVQYAFDTSASGSVFDDGARLESVTYPSGSVVFNDYGSAGTLTDLYHLPYRLRETSAAGAILTEYSWTGGTKIVVADFPAPDFKLDLFRGTAGTYAGLDRFARTIDQFWDGYGTTSDVDRFKYAYDYAGNRTYRDIDASIYATNNKDQAYAYDSLHRLITSDQGTLSGSTISGTPLREEDWTLDALGNWSNYLTKASGTTDLNQARTHNDANEITQIDASSTHIAHDNAGNTTKAPKPTTWSSHFDLIYDAWNRLVQVNDGANTVAVYRYDGRNYRITKAVYSSGVLSYTDHTYYNDDWQALETRRETSGVEDADPREQFVWQPDYIDSLAVRYFDADTDGNLAESSDGPHYYAHDANYNVTAVANASGTVLERYQYDPYGRLTVLDASFATDADGASDIDIGATYTGRLFDAESGRYYYRNRYYDPVTGRFAGGDTERYIDGMNLYCAYFVPNQTDPFGLELPSPQYPIAPRNTPAEECSCIVEREKKDLRWLDDLPACPCTLTEPRNPLEDWRPPAAPWPKGTHPGASMCIRSGPKKPGGPGQQCCYDTQGNLITGGPSAGTPDKIAPDGILNTVNHFVVDVEPFNLCKAAGILGKYLEMRPPNNGKNCTANVK